jgi:hypothetical protein
MKICGPCNLCCKVLHVESLAKPPGRWCEHTRAEAGCAIHGAHPADCRAFACGWLQWEDLGEAWRPSTAGFLIRPEPSQGRLCIDVDSECPDAWRADAYYPVIKAWSASVRERTGCVLVYVDTRCTVIFPEEDIDIGDFRQDEELVVGYLKGRGYRRPLVRLLRNGEVAGEWRGARVEGAV